MLISIWVNADPLELEVLSMLSILLVLRSKSIRRSAVPCRFGGLVSIRLNATRFPGVGSVTALLSGGHVRSSELRWWQVSPVLSYRPYMVTNRLTGSSMWFTKTELVTTTLVATLFPTISNVLRFSISDRRYRCRAPSSESTIVLALSVRPRKLRNCERIRN